MKKIFICIAAFSLCHQLRAQDKLPLKCPADFTITYHYDGGRSPISIYFMLGKDSCIYTKNDLGKTIRKEFALTKTQFNTLYTTLINNRFDKITYTTKERVYDRGGVNIQATWNKGQQQMVVKDAGLSFVDDKWYKQWSAIRKYLENVVNAKIK